MADPSARRRSPSLPPGGAYTRRPLGARTFTRPSSAMSRDTVVCTMSYPASRSADATSACVESARSRTSSRMARCLSRRFILCETVAEYACDSRYERFGVRTSWCYIAPAVERVLVLNASYEPLNVCSMRRAHVLVWKGKAEVLESHGRPLRSSSSTFTRPHVIRLLT